MFQPKCLGCSHVIEVHPYPGNGIGIGCISYPNPWPLWRRGNCPRATHVERNHKPENGNHSRIGQQKQKKFRR